MFLGYISKCVKDVVRHPKVQHVFCIWAVRYGRWLQWALRGGVISPVDLTLYVYTETYRTKLTV